MWVLRTIIILTSIVWLTGIMPSALAANNAVIDGYYQAETSKPFQEVVDELKIAISEKNFRLASHNQIGKAIRERDGEAFPDYDVLQFCNLSYAKELLTIDPDAVRQMPCTVAVYRKNAKAIVVTRLLPINTANPKLNQFGEKMNGILKEIIGYAVGR